MDRLDYTLHLDSTPTINRLERTLDSADGGVRLYRDNASGAVLQLRGVNTKGARMLPTGTMGFASAGLTLKELYTLRAAVDLAIADIERG